LAPVPIVNFLSRLILGYAITLLDLAFELIAAAVDGSQVIISELTPLLLNLAFGPPPVSFDTIPVHETEVGSSPQGEMGTPKQTPRAQEKEKRAFNLE